MNWSDFGPYVAPYVNGCPEPVIIHHARLAAIEFCLKTKCWVKSLDTSLSFGDGLVDIETESTAALVFDIERVAVGGVEWPLVTTSLGIARRDFRSDDALAFSDDLQTITINPVPKSGTAIDIRVVMTLKNNASILPAELEKYARNMAHGAIASIMRIPGQGFTSPEAERHEIMFREQIKNESSRLARGQVASGHGRINPSFM